MACPLQFLAKSGRSTVLPDNRVVDRLAGPAVPNHRGLALVRDADGRDLASTQPRLGQCRAGDRDLRAPNFARIMLHPTGLWEELLELPLRDGADRAGVVKDDGTGTGRSLVQCQDDGHTCL